MTVHTGQEGVGDLNDIDEGVHTGIEGGSGAGAGAPIATVLDGVTAHITIDDLAAVITQTADIQVISIVKGDDPTVSASWCVAGADDATSLPYWSVLGRSPTAPNEGHARTLTTSHVGVLVNATGTGQTQHVDGRYHMFQGADHYSAPNGQCYVQVDGATREAMGGAYARPANDATWSKWFTLGAFRRGLTPDITTLAEGAMGYFAIVTGVQFSQANMDAIWDAFDTGGGRNNTMVVTRAIEAAITDAGAGTLQWAGELNGNATAPHVNAAGADPPIYVDCTFELANYDLTRWAHFAGGAYSVASDEDAQAVEDVYDDVNGDVSFIESHEADFVLGDASVNRAVFGLSGDDDTNGSFTSFGRKSPTGECNVVYRSDAGANILGTAETSQVIFAGSPHLVQFFDTATTGTGTLRAKVDSDAVEALDASYVRASLGVLDIYSPAGRAVGPVPTTVSPLGWVYWHISVAADLESISAAIATAYAGASGQRAKYAAVLQAIIDGGFEASIIYAQAFWEGSVAQYTQEPSGTGATLTGVTYAAEGVSP